MTVGPNFSLHYACGVANLSVKALRIRIRN